MYVCMYVLQDKGKLLGASAVAYLNVDTAVQGTVPMCSLYNLVRSILYVL